MSKIIWTNHALKRINDRKISQNQINQTIFSFNSKLNNKDGSTEFVRRYGSQKVHVIVKENEDRDFIILSCWINPPNINSKDFRNEKFRRNIKNASPLKKMWITFINQLGF